MGFAPAVRTQAKVRMTLNGPSGSGKTVSALKIAHGLGAKIALLDTESGSASKYEGTELVAFPFDVDEAAPPFRTARVTSAIRDAVAAGYDVLIIDSLTHFWKGDGGILEAVDDAAGRMKRPDTHAAWKEGDRLYREMMDAIIRAPIHIIVTMRSKQAYEKEVENGKTTIKKMGMEPEMRAGAEYEFDIEGVLDVENTMRIGKTRIPELKGAAIRLPGEKLGQAILAWCNTGSARPAAPPAPRAAAEAPVDAMPPLSEAAIRIEDVVADKLLAEAAAARPAVTPKAPESGPVDAPAVTTGAELVKLFEAAKNLLALNAAAKLGVSLPPAERAVAVPVYRARKAELERAAGVAA